MNQEEEYRKEVILISLERDNKRLLDIYREGEDKNNLSSNAFKNVYERVSYALSSSSLFDWDKLPEIEERIKYFFEDYYYDNVPSSSKPDLRYYITSFKRFFSVLNSEGEIDDRRLSRLFSLLSSYQ